MMRVKTPTVLLIVVVEMEHRRTRLLLLSPPLLLLLHPHPLLHPHLFEHEDTVPWADELRELGDAPLVEVRPREAAVIEVDFGTAVFPVALACAWTDV